VLLLLLAPPLLPLVLGVSAVVVLREGLVTVLLPGPDALFAVEVDVNETGVMPPCRTGGTLVLLALLVPGVAPAAAPARVLERLPANGGKGAPAAPPLAAPAEPAAADVLCVLL
jgi:hypothetical protein